MGQTNTGEEQQTPRPRLNTKWSICSSILNSGKPRKPPLPSCNEGVAGSSPAAGLSGHEGRCGMGSTGAAPASVPARDVPGGHGSPARSPCATGPWRSRLPVPARCPAHMPLGCRWGGLATIARVCIWRGILRIECGHRDCDEGSRRRTADTEPNDCASSLLTLSSVARSALRRRARAQPAACPASSSSWVACRSLGAHVGRRRRDPPSGRN